MRIPAYYCLQCGQFKKWYQVDALDMDDAPVRIYQRCKHCGHDVINTDKALQKFIEEKIATNI